MNCGELQKHFCTHTLMSLRCDIIDMHYSVQLMQGWQQHDKVK